MDWERCFLPPSTARAVQSRGFDALSDLRTEVRMMLHEFTPQEVFLVVFSAVIVVTFLVNRAHCYDLKRNNHESH
jgi:hypothetical protein